MTSFWAIKTAAGPTAPGRAGSPPDDTSIIAAPLAHLVARRFEQAIEWADHALHEQLRLVSAMRVKAVANDHLGRLEQSFELACVYRLLPQRL